MYDVSSQSSFESVQKWIDDVKNQRGDGAVLALLANKIDIEEKVVGVEEGKKIAERNKVLFKEVSAKSG